ncbi:N-acetylmuramoyl-L-alanine amidase [Clostridium bovifaecis]|uniref:N-acetylmuramoyl-L-alanine amidase n=1 Tax=Clostridium bovifaecis TaxID=2184719 RepID=A0A6I6F7U4_9CLOT|nr:N-acetylmuramoyl-L-alanine amidase [Clostridium bovifaecis]
MNKLKLLLLSVTIAITVSACGNKGVSKEDVTLVGSPKVNNVVEDKSDNTVKESSNNAKVTEENKVENKGNQVVTTVKTEKQEIKQNSNEKNNLQQMMQTSKNSKNPIPKVEYKLSNRTIVIDPGHASKADTGKEPVSPSSSVLKYKQTGGAQGVITNTPEYKINMQVALKLKEYLDEEGFNVVMTKTNNSKTMTNIERAKLGNEADAGLVIRIHADSAENKSANGASMLVPAYNKYTKKIYKQSKLFGEVILNTVTNEVGMRNRGVIERSDMTGFNWSTVPVVLIEMGFLSNPQEDKNLSNEEYQDKIAKGIVKGVQVLTK